MQTEEDLESSEEESSDKSEVHVENSAQTSIEELDQEELDQSESDEEGFGELGTDHSDKST